jgi:hypothetical protein
MFHEGLSVEEDCGLSVLQELIAGYDCGAIVIVICFYNVVSSL